MKKFKLFALAVFAMLSTNVFAASEVGLTFIGDNGVEYQITKDYQAASAGNPEVLGQVTVIRYAYSSQSTAVVIPEQVQNLDNSVAVDLTHKFKVVGIDGAETSAITINTTFAVNTATAHQPFKDCAATSISLPATVMYIGKKAFEGFKGTTVGIPAMSNLVRIDAGAFANAASLETFATENAAWLEEIDAEAFYGCAKLATMTLGAKLKKIENGAFVGTKIATLDLSACVLLDGTNGVNRLFTGTGTFASSLTLGTATAYAVGDATNATLTTVVLPTTNTTAYPIAANAFDGCTKLATIGATANSAKIPAKVASIGTGAFLKTAITKFDLSLSAITTIDAWFSKTGDAVADPSKLEQVILNSSTTAPVAYASFAGLTGISTLKKIGITGAEYTLPGATTVGAGNALAEGVFAGTALEQLDLSKITATTAYALPALFYKEVSSVFAGGNASLTAVVLNEKVNELAANAFAGCPLLASLTVKKADGTAVENLTTLATVNTAAFWQTKLSSLTFGNALTTLTTPFKAPASATTEQGKLALSTADAITIDLSACKDNLTSKKIGDNTFQGLAKLTSITLPANLAEIGANAFDGTGIAEITLNPATVAGKVGNEAFANCKSLKSLTYMPTTAPSATIFGTDPFKGCSLVTIYTNTIYTAVVPTAPTNAKYETTSPVAFETVKDKVRNYAMKGFMNATSAYQFDATECQVYQAYLDGGNITMIPMRTQAGKYNVDANEAVIVRTAEAKKLEPVAVTIGTGAGQVPSSKLITDNCLKSVATETARESVPSYANYMYVLVNNATAGFSFQYFTGTKIKNGNIYVINSKAPESAGRLNIVWLDENGNVEEDATAIKAIEAAEAENGAIYNLQGVRVNNAKKGLYIKNGKKYIIK